ncbi:arrestin domain containing protein [Entamoeba histolytica HM-1:IMSS-B]|uniref:Uncharacterized protein n=6 Tax=Entamoeba histolytica TaxID=5759 RepID=C4M9J1_ENTH1|nr:hypothetical protein EHI_011550 [Entamoeba histolytica HM-1:IMSS]EMD48430.1 arrestin (or Santigen) N-terminal domain containing protein [Entamoeba histolytica KU27]EMH75802.1 arrestin domain containing protein [Entamoeba histolytica HM-1:IMSS-B]EMS15140.1 arrestin (or s-antigen) domain containing protein [Entamoeba histolytica HM-3:IMSS]ENY62097.1 arrestin (or s-antigen), n-terminal domain containing protein [Entamoeba histolytica HM-1:IMSS-A]GAT98336.1 hypothetical protein CL6EHI_011550 [E|eukprot:XP_653204.1 hypothetical protein EHI_011550 [Entamoeba histolytica HM-1:IMSS]
MLDFFITLTHPGHILGEPIQGFVTVTTNSPTFIKGITVFIEGVFNTHYTETITTTETDNEGKVHQTTREVETPKTTIIYSSPKYPVLEELHNHNIALTTELAPGSYSYPFVIQLPKGIPSSSFFNDRDVNVQYMIHCELTKKNGSKCRSDGFVIPLCVNPDYHLPRPRVFCDNSSGVNIQLTLSDDSPSVGDIVQMTLQCTNLLRDQLELRASFVATHNYKTTNVNSRSSEFVFQPILTHSTSTLVGTLTIPLDLPTTTHSGEFSINTYVNIQGKAGRKTIDILFPVEIGYDIKGPQLMTERSRLFGGRRDFTKTTGFYGAHFRMPPSYQTVVDKTLAPGIEQILTVDQQPYYVSHFTRQTSLTPDMNNPCALPYPIYNAAMLPPGWSIGQDYGEWYFIDHNTQTTSWIDPRPLEQRIIPHIIKGKEARFEVEIVKAIGLPVLGWGCPDPYACVWDSNENWIKTNKQSNSLDPVFTKKNKISIIVSKERTNVVVYLYDYHRIGWDVFMGAVNFDLQYFPPDVIIQDWYQLSNFGNKSTAVTGKVLLKVCYKVEQTNEIPTVIINGHSPLYRDYYPDTCVVRDQIKKQNELRKKKKMRENPMMDYEGHIICMTPFL